MNERIVSWSRRDCGSSFFKPNQSVFALMALFPFRAVNYFKPIVMLGAI